MLWRELNSDHARVRAVAAGGQVLHGGGGVGLRQDVIDTGNEWAAENL